MPRSDNNKEPTEPKSQRDDGLIVHRPKKATQQDLLEWSAYLYDRFEAMKEREATK